MKTRRWLAIALLAGTPILLAPISLRAQATPYELNLHVGAFVHDLEDGDDTDAMLGVRFLLQYPSGWGWGGNFDWVAADQIDGEEDIDVNLFLYSFEIDYTIQTNSRARPFVGAGLGAATGRVSDIPRNEGRDDEESETNLLIPLAFGLKYFDDPTRPTWAIRGEIRDNIIFVDEDSVVFPGRDETRHNLEFSGGVSFFF